MLLSAVILLIANALAHVLQYLRMRAESAPSQEQAGVLAFAIINGLIALFLGLNLSWAEYLALAFPLIGGVGLSLNLRNSGGSKALSYLILALDAALVIIFTYLLFFT